MYLIRSNINNEWFFLIFPRNEAQTDTSDRKEMFKLIKAAELANR